MKKFSSVGRLASGKKHLTNEDWVVFFVLGKVRKHIQI